MPGLLHAEMGFRGPSRLADGDHKSGLEALSQGAQDIAEPVRIDIVNEMERQSLTVRLQGTDHQRWSKAASTDPDPEHIRESRAVGSLDGSIDHIPAEGLDVIDLFRYVLLHLRCRCQLRSSQPVVTHLTFLIAIGDRSGLQLLHGSESCLEPWLKPIQMIGIDMHSADIKPDTEIVVIPEEITEPLPLNMSVIGVEIRKAHCVRMIHSRRKLSTIVMDAHFLEHSR